MVVLEAIAFNHDPSSVTDSALNLRRNAATAVTVPEWRRGVSREPADSPAAYAAARVRGRHLRIRARFKRRTPQLRSVEVRAVEAAAELPPWRPAYLPHPQLVWPGGHVFAGLWDYYSFVSYSAYYNWWQSGLATAGNVLGEVEPRRIELDADGTSAFELFDLRNVRLKDRGVGVENIAWRWQYRTGPASSWKDIDVTRHRIYTLLDVPTAPWTQQPFQRRNVDLPWTEALDVACRWAGGARTAEAAAAAVTRATFGLGEGLIEYGCPTVAYSMYAVGANFELFDCSAFLERLEGGIGNGPYVNCTDCASIVATFSNLLGGDLWCSRMGEYLPAFETNPIQAIGSDVLQSPCGWGLGFMYHEVAWTGGCTSSDHVYDACLKVKARPLETAWPPTTLLPVNMRFGENGDGQYRDRIAAPTSRDVCVPRPAERLRRKVR